MRKTEGQNVEVTNKIEGNLYGKRCAASGASAVNVQSFIPISVVAVWALTWSSARS